MAHDAAVLNKPCLYLNYNPVKKSIFKLEDVFNFEYFKKLKHIDAVGWINNRLELSKKILFTLKNPYKVGRQREKWMKVIVAFPLKDNASEIYNIILNIVNK